jgi:hypothetical protein
MIFYSRIYGKQLQDLSKKLHRFQAEIEKIFKEAVNLKEVRKTATIVIVVLIIFFILFQGTSVFAASRFQEVLTRFTNVFIHTGKVEHEHTYAFDGGMAAFFAAGIGSASGVHDGWSIASKSNVAPGEYVYNSYKYVSSYAYYHGATARDALPGQYMRLISGSSYGNEHSNQVGVMPNPGEKGHVGETIAADTTKKDGKYYDYFSHSSSAGTSDGVTRINRETNGSTTVVNVEGYSEILESYVEDSGGSRVGWWSLP